MEYPTINKTDRVQIIIRILMILDFVKQTRFLRGNVTATILLTLVVHTDVAYENKTKDPERYSELTK